jgi:hypothetical protein
MKSKNIFVFFYNFWLSNIVIVKKRNLLLKNVKKIDRNEFIEIQKIENHNQVYIRKW